MSPTTTPSARRTSRHSSTGRTSPCASAVSRTPAASSANSSAGTTRSTTTQDSACSPLTTCTTAWLPSASRAGPPRSLPASSSASSSLHPRMPPSARWGGVGRSRRATTSFVPGWSPFPGGWCAARRVRARVGPCARRAGIVAPGTARPAMPLCRPSASFRAKVRQSQAAQGHGQRVIGRGLPMSAVAPSGLDRWPRAGLGAMG